MVSVCNEKKRRKKKWMSDKRERINDGNWAVDDDRREQSRGEKKIDAATNR